MNLLPLRRTVPLFVRCYSGSNSGLPPPPPVSKWMDLFDVNPRTRRHRICLASTTSATFLAKSFLESGSTPDGRGRVVIEAYAGPGVLSRALLKWPSDKIRKLIILEDQPDYYAHLKDLESCDSRIKVFNLHPSNWDTYDELEHHGTLEDVRTHDWEDEADIEFICHVPHSPLGDQFVAHLLRSIPERSWLFKYGRMRMHFIMAQSLYSRLSGTCKIGTIATATCHSHHHNQGANKKALAPYTDHFWPPPAPNMYSLPQARKHGQPMVAASFTPLVHQIMDPTMLDEWDYCLRRLFVTKASALGKALSSLGPGAGNLSPLLAGPNIPQKERLDMEKRIRDLTVRDWAKIVQAFHQWPFAPENLKLQPAPSGKDHLRD